MDPTAGPVARFASDLRKVRQEADGLSYRAMAQRAGYSVTALSKAAAGERLPSLEVTLAYVRACAGDLGHWEQRWEEANRELAQQTVQDEDEGNGPYPGLARFEAGDSGCFFGRRQLLDDLTATARANRVSVVLGPSGSGKSSLLRAGLIAHLRHLTDAAARPAAIRIFTPGARPMRSHRDRLLPASTPGETWVIVDQFEEVFTLCHDAEERAAFLDALLGAEHGSRLRVVIGLRADFYARCLEHRALATVLAEAALPVVPMNRQELREAITKPAAARTLVVERALTARLVDEVADQPGGLPLMSHVLREVWRRRRGRMLTLESYEAAGGLDGAVARTAETVYGKLTPDERILARRLLLRLITPGQGTPDTKRPAGRGELDAEEDTHARHVLECLARARLVTVAEDTVELAHEALITAWPRLRAWIEEDRQKLLVHRRLTDAARDWAERGQDHGALLRGNALAEAEAAFALNGQDALTSRERHYLSASTAARTRERRVRRAAIGALSLLVVLALVAGTIAWQQSRSGERQRLQIAARRVAEVADGLRYTDPEQARVLSVAAYRLADLPETRSALLGLTTSREDDVFREGDAGPGIVRFLSDDGRRIVTVNDDYIRTWDVRSHRQVHESHNWSNMTDSVPVDLSPDGKKLAIDFVDGIRLWDLSAGQLDDESIPESSGGVADFSPSGHVLTVAQPYGDGTGKTVRLWDLTRRRTLLSIRTDGRWTQAVSLDDRQVALCEKGGPIQVWDIARRRRTITIDADGRCGAARSGLKFSPDAKTLTLVDGNGVHAWRLPSGKRSGTIGGPDVREIAFSPDGRFLAGVGKGEILIWRTAHVAMPALHYSLTGQRRARAPRWIADGRTLRFQSGGSWREVHSIDLTDLTDSAWTVRPIGAALFSPNGRLLSTIRRKSGKDTLSFRDPDTGTVLRSVTGLVPSASSEQKPPSLPATGLMAFSSDSRTFGYAAAVGNRGDSAAFTLWDTKNNYEKRSMSFGGIPAVDSESAVAFGADADQLWVLRSGGRRVERWNTEKDRRTSKLEYRGSAVTVTGVGGFALRSDGKVLATTQNMIATMDDWRFTDRTLSDEAPRALTFSPSGKYLAVGDASGRVTLWSGDVTRRQGVLTGPLVTERRNEPLPVRALAFSPDERTLAVGDGSGTVRLWDVPSHVQLGTELRTPGGAVRALSFDRRGDTLHVSGANAPVQRYAVAPDEMADDECERDGDLLSRKQWKTYVPDVPYRSLC